MNKKRTTIGLDIVLDEQVLGTTTGVQEAVLRSPILLTTKGGVQVQLGPPRVNSLGFQTLPPLQEVGEQDHILADMELHLQLGEGEDIAEIIHDGVKGLEFGAFNVDLEDVDPVVSVLLHEGLEGLPGLAIVVDAVGAANEVGLEGRAGASSLCIVFCCWFCRWWLDGRLRLQEYV